VDVRISSEEVARELRVIPSLPRDALVQAWTKTHGSAPPKGISRRLLERSAAHHLQLSAIGGMPRDLTRRLAGLVRKHDGGAERTGRGTTKGRTRLSPGARLLREWNGRTYTVEVTEAGLHWNGKVWPSLTAIANAITGTRWSGPRFFGL